MPAGGPALVPMGGAHVQDYMRQLQIDLSKAASEQEFLRRLEAALVNADVEVRVAVFGLLASQALSLLHRFKDHADVKPYRDKWKAELRACTVGSVMVEVQHSPYGAPGYMYKVSVVGAEGVDPMLADHPSYSMPNDVEKVARISVQMLYRAQECRFRSLHADLREALVDVGWLQDEFGHLDPDTRAAEARQRMSAAPYERS